MEEKKTIFVDSHVHIYDCYDITKFFQAAISNFSKIHNRLNLTEKFIGVFFLTESGKINYFKEISDNIIHYSNRLKFKFEPTSEDNSLRVIIDSDNYLVLIAGKQIVTKENLEVHAIGTTNGFKDGGNILSVLNIVKENDAVPVIPWGVGKWIGERGKIVEKIIQTSTGIFLGDNSGRPTFWTKPRLLTEGIKNKFYTLRGTDPLPIKSQEEKTGSFGFYFISEFNLEKPSEFLKNYLRSLKRQPNDYGELESFSNFVKNQFLIQYSKLIKKAF